MNLVYLLLLLIIIYIIQQRDKIFERFESELKKEPIIKLNLVERSEPYILVYKKEDIILYEILKSNINLGKYNKNNVIKDIEINNDLCEIIWKNSWEKKERKITLEKKDCTKSKLDKLFKESIEKKEKIKKSRKLFLSKNKKAINKYRYNLSEMTEDEKNKYPTIKLIKKKLSDLDYEIINEKNKINSIKKYLNKKTSEINLRHKELNLNGIYFKNSEIKNNKFNIGSAINESTEDTKISKDQILFYTDVFTYSKNYKNYKVLTMCNIPKQILLISKNSIKLVNNQDRTKVGYINEVDLELFKILLKSQKNYINMNNYEFIRVTKENIVTKLFDEDLPSIDIFIYFDTLLNPLYKQLIKRDLNLVPYNYRIQNNDIKLSGMSLNNNIFKFYLPYSKKKIQSISLNTENSTSDNTNIIYNTILIDTLIFSFSTDDNIKYNKNYLYLLNYFNEFVKLNYYMQHFDFLKIGKDWAIKKQEHSSFKNVMEEFKENGTQLKFKIDERNIIAYKKKMSGKDVKNIVTFKVNKSIINGVPIKEGDKLYTETGFANFFEKKFYYVINTDNKYIYAANMLKIGVSNNLYNIRKKGEKKDKILLNQDIIKKYKLEENDMVYFIINKKIIMGKIVKYTSNKEDVKDKKLTQDEIWANLYNSIVSKRNIIHKDLNNLKNEKLFIDIDKIDTNNNFLPQFSCYQNNTILTKTECEDVFDKVGKKKAIYNWDRPCISNTECPFYLKNKNYTNERGGCNNGYCELPVGVKRLSYREYDKRFTENNFPRCHGCDINNGIDCCEKQKKNKKMKGSNYVFENDNEDIRLSKFF